MKDQGHSEQRLENRINRLESVILQLTDANIRLARAEAKRAVLKYKLMKEAKNG